MRPRLPRWLTRQTPSVPGVDRWRNDPLAHTDLSAAQPDCVVVDTRLAGYVYYDDGHHILWQSAGGTGRFTTETGLCDDVAVDVDPPGLSGNFALAGSTPDHLVAHILGLLERWQDDATLLRYRHFPAAGMAVLDDGRRALPMGSAT